MIFKMTNLGIICSGSEGEIGYVPVYVTSVGILEPDRVVRISLICDFSNVVAFGHNELWRPKAAKFITKLAKISPNGNTAYHSRPPHWSCCHRWNCRVHIIYYCYSFAKPAALASKFEH